MLVKIANIWTLYRRYILSGVALIGAILVFLWASWVIHSNKTPATIKEYVPVEQVITNYKTNTITVPKVVVIEKADLKKLDLPKAVLNNVTSQVLAQGKVKSSDMDTNVVAVMDTSTGKTELIEKPVPVPFFRFLKKTEVGVAYGLTGSGQEAEVFGSLKAIGIGPVEVGVRGEVHYGVNTNKASGFVGIQATVPIDW